MRCLCTLVGRLGEAAEFVPAVARRVRPFAPATPPPIPRRRLEDFRMEDVMGAAFLVCRAGLHRHDPRLASSRSCRHASLFESGDA